MGFKTKVQLIKRKRSQQFYVNKLRLELRRNFGITGSNSRGDEQNGKQDQARSTNRNRGGKGRKSGGGKRGAPIKTEREILRDSKLLKRFEKAVKRFIERGLEVQAMPGGEAKERAVAKLEKQLDRLARMRVTKGKATTLVKRIEKYRDHLIRFVTHPGVEFHNNRAERQLRPLVVNRKVSFGSSTDHGARRYCIIHTIVETCKLQGIDPIEFIRRACTSGGLDIPSLAGPDPPQYAASA